MFERNETVQNLGVLVQNNHSRRLPQEFKIIPINVDIFSDMDNHLNNFWNDSNMYTNTCMKVRRNHSLNMSKNVKM